MRELRGLTYAACLTLRRQLFARKSLVAIVLVGLLCLATNRWARFEARLAERAHEQISGMEAVLDSLHRQRDERQLVVNLLTSLPTMSKSDPVSNEEVAATFSAMLESHGRESVDVRSPGFLDRLGLGNEPEPWSDSGWTAGRLDDAYAGLARDLDVREKRLIARTLHRQAERLKDLRGAIRDEERQIRRLKDEIDLTPQQRADQTIERFSKLIVMAIYVSFLLPILSLIYATAAFGDEREEQTLIYLLIRPLARYRIYLAKGLGIVPLVVVVGAGSFGLVCLSAGSAGHVAWHLFWPAVVRGSVAYTALFLLVGAVFPRPVVIAIFYSFFCESVVGNMPGTIKRLAISFHTRCLMFDAGAAYDVAPDSALQFLPISGTAAAWVLDLVTVALLLLGAWWFHRKEYPDIG